MTAIKWSAVAVLALGSALSVVGLVMRMRDREEIKTKFAQYLPAAG